MTIYLWVTTNDYHAKYLMVCFAEVHSYDIYIYIYRERERERETER